MRPPLFLAALALGALLLAGGVGAAGTPLSGSVGPGFTIGPADAGGARVTRLDAGTYALTVRDVSDEHNFHLRGPGVNAATEIEEQGTKTFEVTLVDGQYTFVCDAHAGTMKGGFTVGAAPPTPPAGASPTKLVLTVTGKAVRLMTPSGGAVKALKAGPAVVTVRDRSAARGARLAGAGVSKTTGLKFVGTTTWKVKLTAGTLAYGSDARKPVLKGGRVPVS